MQQEGTPALLPLTSFDHSAAAINRYIGEDHQQLYMYG
jgi:hypothetical protein